MISSRWYLAPSHSFILSTPDYVGWYGTQNPICMWDVHTTYIHMYIIRNGTVKLASGILLFVHRDQRNSPICFTYLLFWESIPPLMLLLLKLQKVNRKGHQHWLYGQKMSLTLRTKQSRRNKKQHQTRQFRAKTRSKDAPDACLGDKSVIQPSLSHRSNVTLCDCAKVASDPTHLWLKHQTNDSGSHWTTFNWKSFNLFAANIIRLTLKERSKDKQDAFDDDGASWKGELVQKGLRMNLV